MSNAGRKLIRWTYSETMRLHRLYAAGKTREEIATELNMTPDRVRQRLQWEAQAGTIKLKRMEKKRETQRIEQKSPRTFIDLVTSGPKPTNEALRCRDARLAAMPRDLTAALCGDPLPGFSALERRI